MPLRDINQQSDTISEESKYLKVRASISFIKLVLLICFFVTVVMYALQSYVENLNQPPVAFPQDELIIIEPGMTARAITEHLANMNVVKSESLLYYTLMLRHDPSGIKASAYRFTEPLTTFEIASRITEGDFDSDLVRLTHIEGERVSQLATRAAELLPGFNQERFLRNTESLEGKLWPDTYFIPPQYTDEDLLALLQQTFTEQLAPYDELIRNHTLSLDEILVLASIIEREANSPESMRLVSSVLQNRLEIGMALQADASIEYVLDKPLAQLTPDDLKIDSPYNTYVYPGLPPTPIGNPGLEAILAVLQPAESDYFYYLTDSAGVFHFAETYAKHLANIERYLR